MLGVVVSLAAAFGAEPTYEGLKEVWEEAKNAEELRAEPTYEGLKARFG